VWTWDITKFRGLERRTSYHLYVVIDIFCRYVVGWMVAQNESGALAKQFLAETFGKHGIPKESLTLHSDRGTSMRSKTIAEMLDDLGVVKSHSRPRTSNDNPFRKRSSRRRSTSRTIPAFLPRSNKLGIISSFSLHGTTTNTRTAGSPC